MTIDLSKRFPGFTRCEREICAMVLKGLTAKEIGRIRGISPRTVEDHRANVFKKAKATSIAHLAYLTFGEPEFVA